METDTIFEFAAYADEQGGPDGADAMAREWAVLNKKIGSQIELITDPHYFIACRL